jgi:protein-tyrosine phosphatase
MDIYTRKLPLVAPFWIESFEDGDLATMRCPIGLLYLRDSISELKNMGVNIVVSLLTDFETKAMGLEEEKDICEEVGIEFISLPINDRTVPDDFSAVHTLAATLLQELREETSIVIHCRLGIGRSSLIAGAIMVVAGWEATDAYNAISMSRDIRVPDTPEQDQWLYRFSKYIQENQ